MNLLTPTVVMKQEDPLRKKLAALEHEQWIGKEKVEHGLEDFEYLLHHITINDKGNEEIHHCLLYDHIANMYEQCHLTIMNGKVFLDGKVIKDGSFHVLKRLEPSQEVVWSDEEADENNIKAKKMKVGMTLKEKAKEW